MTDSSSADGSGCSHPASILVADDEPLVRFLCARVLRESGFLVHEAGNGREALSAIRTRREPFDLLVLDVRMPYITGPALAKRVADAYPPDRVLFMSGNTDGEVRRYFDPAETRVLLKPFDMDEFSRHVRRLVERTEAQ